MYQTALLMLFSLLSLHLTNKCWAQELTYTIATIDPTATVEHSTTTSSSDIITVPIATIDPFANTGDDPPTYVIDEDPTVVPEPSSDPIPTTDSTSESNSTTDGPSDSTTSTISEAPIPPMPTEFTAFTNLEVVRDCDELLIAWAGTDIMPPYWVSWSTGTGEIGDASILGKEIPMSLTCSNYIRWQTPPTSNATHGNVVRFSIEDKRGEIATVWVAWKATGAQECPPLFQVLDRSCLLGSPFSIPEWDTPAPTIQITDGNQMTDGNDNHGFAASHPPAEITPDFGPMVTLTVTVPAEPSPGSPSEIAGAPTEMVTLTLLVPAGPTPNPLPMSMPSATPHPGTVKVDRPPVVAVPIEGNNSPSPPRNNSPRPSGINDPQPSGYSGSNSQDTNNDNDVHANQFLRTFVVPLGDSTTLTIVTEIPHPVESTRDNVGVQSSLIPATTLANGQKNSTRRTGLPPAATAVIVGSLLGGLTLWILLVIWLKKRKRASTGFKELEDPVSFTPTEDIKVTPYTAPARPPSSVNANSNHKRMIQEIIRSDSPVTSIGGTSTYSHLFNAPISDTQSQEPSYSGASSSKPLIPPPRVLKSPRGSLI